MTVTTPISFIFHNEHQSWPGGFFWLQSSLCSTLIVLTFATPISFILHNEHHSWPGGFFWLQKNLGDFSKDTHAVNYFLAILKAVENVGALKFTRKKQSNCKQENCHALIDWWKRKKKKMILNTMWPIFLALASLTTITYIMLALASLIKIADTLSYPVLTTLY